MKVIILSRGPNLYSTRRLVSVARRRGHNVEIMDVLRMSVLIDQGVPRLYYEDEEIEYPDVVIPRIGAPVTYYGLTVLRHLEMAGAVTVNKSDAIANARDKLRSMQMLSAKGVPLPDTAFTCRNTCSGALDDLGDGPVVIKLVEGTQGKGVMLAPSRSAAKAILEAFGEVEKDLLVQRFVSESSGRDIRAFVVGREVVAVMERRAPPGEFRSNLHQGGSARQITLTRAVERVALRATRALGLDVAGVDLLMSTEGPLVIEVNPCPGLEGIERVSSRNVAGAVIDQMEYLAEPYLPARERRRLRRVG